MDRPTWVSPPTGDAIAVNTPIVWLSAVSANPAHFQIELDRTDTFDTADLVRRKSFLDSDFEYWTGSAWATVPASGLPAASTGAQVRYTPADQPTGRWYRRVRQSS